MSLEFATAYRSIIEKLDSIDPVKYGITRNYIDGGVTYLSPYISRGVLSTKQVLNHVLAKGYKLTEIECFVKELCWRDYFQRIAQSKDVNQTIKKIQAPVLNHEIPKNILNANTGILSLDLAIEKLYASGYMHNHCRMYIASVVCNVAKSNWHLPAQWMYYYLLDGDWASNACSWQWVAGANSHKKYYANQENINKYSGSNQCNTFLDTSYELLETMIVPETLQTTEIPFIVSKLPAANAIQLNEALPTFIYNYYNLDPLWHAEEEGNRILLIEPDHFNKYPVSEKCINFMLDLSKNIPAIQLFIGSFKSFGESYPANTFYFKEHPLNIGYSGIQDERDWIVPGIDGYFPSFFSYWNQIKNTLSLK